MAFSRSENNRLQGTSLIHTLTGSVCFCGPEPSISRGFGCKTDRLIGRVNQTACPAHRSDLSAGRALSLLPERVTRELAGLLTARSCRQTGTTPCRRACPKAVCGGVGRAKSVLQTGTTRTREGISGSGSPMMGPKTLPGSESHTGKTPTSLSHQSQTESRHTLPRLMIARPRFLGDGVLAQRE